MDLLWRGTRNTNVALVDDVLVQMYDANIVTLNTHQIAKYSSPLQLEV